MSRPDELGLVVIKFQKIRPSGNYKKTQMCYFIQIYNFTWVPILYCLMTNHHYNSYIHCETIFFLLYFTFWLLQSNMPHSKPLFYWGKQVWLTASNWNEKEIPICTQWAKNGKISVTKWICSKSLIIDRAKLGIFLSGLGRVWHGVIFCPYWPFLPSDHFGLPILTKFFPVWPIF